MYIVTFYSFRGGVGRTTALVNVGLELVRRGRKVLLVDFDLEAPDLTAFAPLCRTEPHRGVVEYVAAYREQLTSPDFSDYRYEVEKSGQKGGQLWVMPAGQPGSGYWETLANIDWQTLYDRESGYLFVEDTRLQWQQLGVDYVLIDTHAGITPALGVTMRQLADVVVMMFARRDEGLDELSWRINGEAAQTGRKPIEQLFVAARVIEADEAVPTEYENDGGVFCLAATIPFSHRLLLGEQSVEQEHCDRPTGLEHRRLAKDRLAKEYRRLANAIIARNFADDPDGARLILHDIHNNPWKAVELWD